MVCGHICPWAPLICTPPPPLLREILVPAPLLANLGRTRIKPSSSVWLHFTDPEGLDYRSISYTVATNDNDDRPTFVERAYLNFIKPLLFYWLLSSPSCHPLGSYMWILKCSNPPPPLQHGLTFFVYMADYLASTHDRISISDIIIVSSDTDVLVNGVSLQPLITAHRRGADLRTINIKAIQTCIGDDFSLSALLYGMWHRQCILLKGKEESIRPTPEGQELMSCLPWSWRAV